MHDTLSLLNNREFPPINREEVKTVQINLGYRCNQACFHCHVNASPDRKEQMSIDTIKHVIQFIDKVKPAVVDLTGGAPELNPHFRELVSEIRDRGIAVIDRCNLTILFEYGQKIYTSFSPNIR